MTRRAQAGGARTVVGRCRVTRGRQSPSGGGDTGICTGEGVTPRSTMAHRVTPRGTMHHPATPYHDVHEGGRRRPVHHDPKCPLARAPAVPYGQGTEVRPDGW